MDWIEILKYAGVPGALLAIYFGHLRFGYKVGEHHTFNSTRFVATGISRVTLTNLKDRSTPIFALYAVQGDVLIHLIKFDSPIVLKSFESVKIDIPRVSEYLVDGKPYEFLPGPGEGFVRTKIYYSTVGKLRLCKPFSPPSPDESVLERGRTVKTAFILTDEFNGRVYSPAVIYMLGYQVDGEWKDAFIDKAGFVGWGMLPNGVPKSVLKDPQLVANHLLRASPHVQDVVVRKAPGWNVQFAKGVPFNDRLDGRPFWGARELVVEEPAG